MDVTDFLEIIFVGNFLLLLCGGEYRRETQKFPELLKHFYLK
jgi:hypothetical protein